MKNVLKLLLAYFLVLLIGCFVGTVIVSEFFTTLHFIVGKKQVFFSVKNMLESFIVVIPLVLVICPMMLCFYVSRHNSKKASSVITYIILSLLTWLILFPAYLTFSKKFSPTLTQYFVRTDSSPSNDAILSSGYFRKYGRFVFYHAPNGNSEIDALSINMDGSNQTNMISEQQNVSEKLLEQSFPFDDLLIRDALSFPILPIFFGGYINIVSNARSAWGAGVIYWLYFAIFGVALCSVYAFVGMSGWKIINSIAVVFWTIAIVVLNGAYYSVLKDLISFPSWLPDFFSNIPNAPLVLVNFLIFFIFLIVGIISAIRQASKRRHAA